VGFISPTNSSGELTGELTGELVPDDAIITDINAIECVRRCRVCLTTLHRSPPNPTPLPALQPWAMGFISPANSSWDLTGELVPDDAIIMDIDATECVRRCQTYPGPCVTAQYVPGMQRCVLKKEYGTAVSTAPGYLAFVKKCAVDNGGCGQRLCQQGQPNTCIDPKEYGFRFKDKDLDYTGPHHPNLPPLFPPHTGFGSRTRTWITRARRWGGARGWTRQRVWSAVRRTT
ncbi:unnamed protein product, partial [Closterium sp. Naga37s-1]